MMSDGVSVFRRERTERLGDVPETEPRPVLEPLPFLPFGEDEEVAPTPPAVEAEPMSAHEKHVEAAFRQLRYRAHRYHGVTRAKPPASKHAVDVAASELARAAVKFDHALGAKPKFDPENPDAPCACIYCV